MRNFQILYNCMQTIFFLVLTSYLILLQGIIRLLLIWDGLYILQLQIPSTRNCWIFHHKAFYPRGLSGSGILGEAIDGASFVMVLSKIPPLFCNWWAEQMRILNNENARVTFHMVLLADALPCSWTSLVHLRGSRLDAMRLDRYRRKTTFFDPCVPVAMTSATSTHVVLKKMRAITFTTEAVDGSFEKVFSTWQV